MNQLNTLCSTSFRQLPAIAKYVQHFPHIYISSRRQQGIRKNEPVTTLCEMTCAAPPPQNWPLNCTPYKNVFFLWGSLPGTDNGGILTRLTISSVILRTPGRFGSKRFK